MKTVVTERVLHDGVTRISIRFPFDPELIKITRGLSDALWSKRMGCWHVPDKPGIIRQLVAMLKKSPTVDYRADLIDSVGFFEKKKFIDSFVEIL